MKHFIIGSLSTVVALPIFLILFLQLGIYPVNADTDPGWLETKLAQTAVHSYVSKQAASLPQPPPASEGVLMAGMEKFKNSCSGCHGAPTRNDATFSNALYPKAPRFGSKGIDDFNAQEIFWITKHGIRMSGMPAYKGMLDDQDIWAIAVFIKNLSDLPQNVETKWQEPK